MSEEKEATSMPSELRRELAKWAFLGTVIAALIGAVGAIVAAGVAIIPLLPPAERIYSAEVSAATYPFANTNIPIEKGDDVQIIVQGADAYWNCGKGSSSTEGFFNDRWDRNVAISANHCELIGCIRPGLYFRIGAYEQFEATESGFLFLGANDSPVSNYFGDNSGTVVVKVIIRQ
jgi:hypothetical protein